MLRLWPLLLLLAACDRKNPHADMKAAETWDDPEAPGTDEVPEALQANPHGMDELPPGHPSVGGVAGGGGGGGGGGGMMDLPSPDPDRPIDLSKFLKGAVTLSAATKDKLPGPGAPHPVLFMAVHRPGPDGKPVDGAFPIAVDIIDPLPAFPFAFDLHEGKAMIDGTNFDGDVLVIARVDQDADVDTRQPGDLYGQVRTTIPAGEITLSLDTIGQ